MKKRKGITGRVLLVAVIATMLAATACSSNSGNKGGDNASPQNSASGPAVSSESATPNTEADPFGKYDPAIIVNTAVNVSPSTKYAPGESPESNVWTKEFEKDLGIKLKFSWSVPSEQWNDKINVAIASNDLPDMIMVNDSQMKQLVESDAIADLTEAYNKFASPLLKKYMQSYEGKVLGAATFDGKIMGIPPLAPVVGQSLMVWIRKDWLDNLGQPDPASFDDILRIAEAFTTSDPDGNGKPDTFGIGINKDTVKSLAGFMSAYNAYPTYWLKTADGKLAYGSIQPETKAALTELQQLYKDGVVDKEFGVKDAAKMNEDVAAGKFGILFGNQSTPISPLTGSLKNDPNANWLPYPITTIDGSPYRTPLNAKPSSFLVAKKGVKNPEVVVKAANLYIEKFYGEHATADDYNRLKIAQVDDGKGGKMKIETFLYAPVRVENPDKAIAAYQHVNQALSDGKTDILTVEEQDYYDAVKKYMESKDVDSWGYYRIYGPAPSSYSVISDYYVKNNSFVYNEFTGAATDTMSQKKSTLDKMEAEVFTQIIMGESLDKFDKFVSDWKSLGGEQIASEVNEWYAKQ